MRKWGIRTKSMIWLIRPIREWNEQHDYEKARKEATIRPDREGWYWRPERENCPKSSCCVIVESSIPHLVSFYYPWNTCCLPVHFVGVPHLCCVLLCSFSLRHLHSTFQRISLLHMDFRSVHWPWVGRLFGFCMSCLVWFVFLWGLLGRGSSGCLVVVV